MFLNYQDIEKNKFCSRLFSSSLPKFACLTNNMNLIIIFNTSKFKSTIASNKEKWRRKRTTLAGHKESYKGKKVSSPTIVKCQLCHRKKDGRLSEFEFIVSTIKFRNKFFRQLVSPFFLRLIRISFHCSLIEEKCCSWKQQ